MIIGRLLALVSALCVLHDAIVKTASAETVFPSPVLAQMNVSADPCEDFYEYACGQWVHDTPLPADRGFINFAWDKTDTALIQTLRDILEGKKPVVSALYESCMDVTALNDAGSTALNAMLKRIEQAPDANELMALVGKMMSTRMKAFIDMSVHADPKNTSRNVFVVSEGRLTLPDSSMYADDTFASLSLGFRKYIAKILELAGYSANEAMAAADAVVNVESRIAGVMSGQNSYDPVTVADLAQSNPLVFGSVLTGSRALKAASLTNETVIINAAKPFFDAVEVMLRSLELAELKWYVKYKWIDYMSNVLTEDFDKARFEFYQRFLNGVQQAPPRWRQCVEMVRNELPHLMGMHLADAVDSAATEAAAKDMIQTIQRTMESTIQTTAWLDNATKQNALKKLAKLTSLIGHSEHVEAYKFAMQSDALALNVQRIGRARFRKELAKIGQAIDKTEWWLSGAIVEAYYDQQANQIVFPLGILQNPYFDASRPAAQNFGALGWWSDATDAEFSDRAECIRSQFSSFTVRGSSGSVLGHMNGDATLGENIADSAGLKLAYAAYQAHSSPARQEETFKNQNEQDKLFFVAYAQNWCSKHSDAAMTQLLAADPPAPPFWRVNGAVMNNVAFAQTFQCAANTRMNPTTKCEPIPQVRSPFSMIILRLLPLASALCVATAAATPSPKTAFPSSVLALMNASADPCEDFYEYACGQWVHDTPLPADRGFINFASDKIDTDLIQTLRGIFEAKKPVVSALYDSCMNVAALNVAGATALTGMVTQIDQASGAQELMALLGKMVAMGMSSFIEMRVHADPKNTSRNALVVAEGLLTLPDSSMYADNAFASLAPGFREYIIKILELAGYTKNEATGAADAVVSVESRIAGAMVGEEGYAPVTVADLSQSNPLVFGSVLAGTRALEDSRLTNETRVINTAKPFFDAVERILGSTELVALKWYVKYVWIDFMARFLTEDFDRAQFEFYERFLNGVQQPPPRWRQCVEMVRSKLPHLVGNHLADAVDSAATDMAARKMIRMIHRTMKLTIQTTSWLDNATKQNALKKLAKITALIGHSQQVERFKIEMQSDALARNVQRIGRAKFRKELRKIGQPVDKTEWWLSGAVTEAYYDAQANQIVFPLGILQKPLFDADRPAAQNFGAIGMIVGHEITHAFDNLGRQFDDDGNIQEWWSDATDAEFSNRAECIRAQFSSFPVKGLTGSVLGLVNGNTTLGENIADSGGLKLAYTAYRAHWTSARRAEALHPQFEHDKLFFVAFAQTMCRKFSDEAISQYVAADPHTPSYWRVNGAVMNNADFAGTFHCAANAPMNPSSKCEVW
ncbi:TPA: hypothetical protein N0F65_011835 [Lagenidium giganteum]|uniref:Endothelin-converting enzyme 1 n=1 Tax=Lagenidium giganteum TaxID=4803 RepID=A0AAV2Z3F2_9STRA|nr:TPA: hypothetical protein N0F65_011835 [Lagenidium giganteum]